MKYITLITLLIGLVILVFSQKELFKLGEVPEFKEVIATKIKIADECYFIFVHNTTGNELKTKSTLEECEALTKPYPQNPKVANHTFKMALVTPVYATTSVNLKDYEYQYWGADEASSTLVKAKYPNEQPIIKKKSEL